MSTTDLDPDDPPKPVRQKWETELEEILAASDRESTAAEKARGSVATARYRAPGEVRRLTDKMKGKWASGAWLLIFLALVVGAFALRHFSPFLGRTLAIAAVALLVIIVVRGVMRPTDNGESPRMWRGRDMGPQNPSEQSWRSRLFDRDRRD